MANNKEETEEQEVKFSEKPIFSWQAPEFVRYEKDQKWFWSILAVAIVLVVIFIFQRHWSGVAFIVVATMFITTLSGLKPRNVTCSVFPEGVVVDKKAYHFSQFKSFWVTTSGDLVKFNLQLLGRFAGQVIMPVLENPEQIRVYLAKHLAEEAAKNDINDMLNKLLRI